MKDENNGKYIKVSSELEKGRNERKVKDVQCQKITKLLPQFSSFFAIIRLAEWRNFNML